MPLKGDVTIRTPDHERLDFFLLLIGSRVPGERRGNRPSFRKV
jgi:hypothetical protein